MRTFCGMASGDLIMPSIQKENAQSCRPALADKNTSEQTAKPTVIANTYTELALPGTIKRLMYIDSFHPHTNPKR